MVNKERQSKEIKAGEKPTVEHVFMPGGMVFSFFFLPSLISRFQFVLTTTRGMIGSQKYGWMKMMAGMKKKEIERQNRRKEGWKARQGKSE